MNKKKYFIILIPLIIIICIVGWLIYSSSKSTVDPSIKTVVDAGINAEEIDKIKYYTQSYIEKNKAGEPASSKEFLENAVKGYQLERKIIKYNNVQYDSNRGSLVVDVEEKVINTATQFTTRKVTSYQIDLEKVSNEWRISNLQVIDEAATEIIKK